MKILMLVNWKIEYTSEIPKDKQPPDYYIEGQTYWFFRYFQDIENLQVDVVDMHSFPWLEKFEQNKIRFYIWQTLKCIPKLNKYDLVLSHGMQSGIVLCLWRRLFGKGKYKHIVFDIGAFNSAREKGHALKLMQFASKSLDGVIYHTEIQKKYYEKCHPWLVNKAKFIVFGTDPEYFSQNREEIDNEMEKPYILCVGYSKRDWITLIKAYENLATDISLRLIGNKNIKVNNPKIEIFDKISIVQLKHQIRGALFCVLPLESFNYSYGQMTLLQQMALGKAIVAADAPSLSAYTEKETLLLYEPGNEEMLKREMQKLINDPKLRAELGNRAERVVQTVFNEKNMALGIEQMIGETMKGK